MESNELKCGGCENNRNKTFGFSASNHKENVYKGIKIKFDEDHDERVYFFIDWLLSREETVFLQKNLLAIKEIGEHEGLVTIYWRKEAKGAKEFLEDSIKYASNDCFGYPNQFNHPNGDLWGIEHEYEDKEEYNYFSNIYRLITPEQRYLVLKRQSWKCNNCSERLKYNKYSKWEGEIAHIDHIHPYSLRDSYIHGEVNINETENLQALCGGCNLKKGKKIA